MNRIRSLYCFFIFFALFLPLVRITGLKGVFQVAGVEHISPPPSWSIQAMLSGKFQQETKAFYEGRFFGRQELLILKNGCYELLNAGQFHSGYSGNIIQGREGTLFEKGCLNVFFNPPVKEHTPAHHQVLTDTAATLKAALAEHGVPFGVILAPSKPLACPDFIPSRYVRFNRAPADFDLYAGLSKALSAAGITHINGALLCTPPYLNTDALFPYSGTHWSVFGAALAATNLLYQLNPALPRPTVEGFEYKTTPYDRTDRDLAFLLNLPYHYRSSPDRYPYPVWGSPLTGSHPGRVIILGDSFCDQLALALKDSGAYPHIFQVSNRRPDPTAFRKAVQEADLLIYTYSSYSLSRSRFVREMQAIIEMLKNP